MAFNTYYCSTDSRTVDWWLANKQRDIEKLLPGRVVNVERKDCLVARVQHKNLVEESYPVICEPGETKEEAVNRLRREFSLVGGRVLSQLFPPGVAVLVRVEGL